MNKNQVKGKAEQVKGKVEQGVGKATGDEKMQVRGKADEMKGKARSTAGNVQHKAHRAADEIREGTRDTTR